MLPVVTEPATTGLERAAAGVRAAAFGASLLGISAGLMNTELEGAGIRPRYAVMPGGDRIAISSLPKELREFAREVIAVVGIPRMAAAIVHGSFTEATNATNALRQLAMPSAISTMDGDGNESPTAGGVVFFPIAEPLGTPPDDLVSEGLAGLPVAVVIAPEKQSALDVLKSSLVKA